MRHFHLRRPRFGSRQGSASSTLYLITPLIKPLETRRLKAAFPDTSHNPDTSGNDTIVFEKTSNGHYQVNFNGTLYDYGTGVLSMSIDAGDGDDFVQVDSGTIPSSISTTLTGNLGNDSLQGGPGSDSLDGSAGNDVLAASAGNDTLAGGTGTDTAYAATLTGSYQINWSLDGVANDDVLLGGVVTYTDSVGTEEIQGTAQADTIVGSGNDDTLIGGGGNDSISGVGGDDSIEGDSGNDTLDGGSGNDYIVGGSGTDSCLGEGGNDSFDLSDGAGGDSADGGSGTDTLSAHDTGDTWSNIEFVD